ncbi:MAG: hypothetical protein ACRC57_00455 [Sarcina sp.]
MDNKDKSKLTLNKLNESKLALNNAIRKIGFIKSNISKEDIKSLEEALDTIRDIENKLYDYIEFEL